ncbi:LAQU0S24e00562g1_1 [Lachancea quebecensis]|uniref:Type 1 phosphatases regulator n=1 Tax=Lachancea quebecensis TaxID=1654605 RepID=A0A0N7MNF6_9SACH|nr:LAQU0S24e00562g1_1 [Lachancea quebecensis]
MRPGNNAESSKTCAVDSSTTSIVQEPVPVLQLRGSPHDQREGAGHTLATSGGKEKREVRWKEDVVDNEHMNKKKSKVCCIFHPQQDFEDMGEEECGHCDHSDPLSPSPSSSSSSSSSESESEKALDRESRHNARKERRKRKLEQKRSSSPNAYEIQPDYSQNKDKKTNKQSN